jgi:hypothetical protein
MNKKPLIYSAIALIPTLAIGAFLTQSVSAHGGIGGPGFDGGPEDLSNPTALVQQFNDEASLLGISVDDVKNAWANGTSIQDLAKAKGIDETTLQAKMKAAREAQIKNQIQALVSNGTITQAQADARLVFLQKQETQRVANHKTGVRGPRGQKNSDDTSAQITQ